VPNKAGSSSVPTFKIAAGKAAAKRNPGFATR